MLTLAQIKQVTKNLTTAAAAMTFVVMGANAAMALDNKDGTYTTDKWGQDHGSISQIVLDAKDVYGLSVSIQDIAAANNVRNPNNIQPNVTLTIPGLAEHIAATTAATVTEEAPVLVASVDTADVASPAEVATDAVVAQADTVVTEEAPVTEEAAPADVVVDAPAAEETEEAAPEVDAEPEVAADEPAVEQTVEQEAPVDAAADAEAEPVAAEAAPEEPVQEEPVAEAAEEQKSSAQLYAEILADTTLTIEEKLKLIEENCADKREAAETQQAEAVVALDHVAELTVAQEAAQQVVDQARASLAAAEASLAEFGVQHAEAIVTAEREQAEADAALEEFKECADTCVAEAEEVQPEVAEEAPAVVEEEAEVAVDAECEVLNITVQPGDGYEKLATRHGVTIASLIESNGGEMNLNRGDVINITDCDRVEEGSAIDAYKVGLTQAQISTLYPAPVVRTITSTPVRASTTSVASVSGNLNGFSNKQGQIIEYCQDNHDAWVKGTGGGTYQGLNPKNAFNDCLAAAAAVNGVASFTADAHVPGAQTTVTAQTNVIASLFGPSTKVDVDGDGDPDTLVHGPYATIEFKATQNPNSATLWRCSGTLNSQDAVNPRLDLEDSCCPATTSSHLMLQGDPGSIYGDGRHYKGLEVDGERRKVRVDWTDCSRDSGGGESRQPDPEPEQPSDNPTGCCNGTNTNENNNDGDTSDTTQDSPGSGNNDGVGNTPGSAGDADNQGTSPGNTPGGNGPGGNGPSGPGDDIGFVEEKYMPKFAPLQPRAFA